MTKHNLTPSLSDKAADIILGGVLKTGAEIDAVDTGYLEGFLRRLSHALDDAAGQLQEWAWKSIHTFPAIPTEAEVAQQFPPFTLPMPKWEA